MKFEDIKIEGLTEEEIAEVRKGFEEGQKELEASKPKTPRRPRRRRKAPVKVTETPIVEPAPQPTPEPKPEPKRVVVRDMSKPHPEPKKPEVVEPKAWKPLVRPRRKK